MQAVIALCHFCEDHGPRVLVTCQPMRSLPMTFSTANSYDKLEHSPGSSQEIVRHIRQDSSVKEPDKGEPIFYGDCTRSVFDTEERCNACTSYGNGPCLLSNDHPNKTTYISSQIALKDQVFDRVKVACVRSLSCEITNAARETINNVTQPMRIGGPVNTDSETLDMENVKKKDGYLMFGDADQGYCLSFAFRLQDAKARGFLRLFSLLILTQDMASMTTNHDFYLEALRIMKDKLQDLAAVHYQVEMKEMDTIARPDHASMSCRIPQQQLFYPRKIIIDTNRNLQTITGNDNIWGMLHKQMMWTLRTQTLRYMDQVMEGVPTQDMLVMMEMEHSDIAELDLDQPNQAEITHQQLGNLKIIARAFAEYEIKDLDLLVRQVITGRQLVVESDHQISAKQFILALTNLLPIGCLRINTCADQHYQSFLYNMLGTTVPIHIPSNEDVLVIRVTANGEPSWSMHNYQHCSNVISNCYWVSLVGNSRNAICLRIKKSTSIVWTRL
ncbi:unnamed protein product [Auanema sp. JU1783]|nr:unnamed protein product [Auanema sp. JU1783]